MPDVSNEDLMKLIYRVIKKQDALEKTMHKVLELIESKKIPLPKTEFKFYPVANQGELEHICKKIEKDPDYKQSLIRFLERKNDVQIDDLFTEDFLFEFNIKGVNGKKSLEGVPLFDEIFVELKRRQGLSEKQITTVVMQVLRHIKSRIYMRIQRSRKKHGSSVHENKSSNEERSESLEVDSTEIPIQAEYIDMDYLIKDESDDDSESPETYFDDDEEEEVLDEYRDELNTFRPIKNDHELKTISEKIRTDPQYTRKTSLQLVTASSDGIVKLSQIFALEFMKDYALHVGNKKKRLSILLPYKAFYFDIRKKLGDSLKEIESDAALEIQSMHNRYKNQLQHKNKY
uniref:CSON002467 protein n=1 Tax=Culicoides sonorensis TaxID=179676 RepID=A0A336LVU3_CULSO